MVQSKNNGATDLRQSGSDKGFIAFAAVSGAVSVMAGAFASHGLSADAEPVRVGWLHTGSLYEALHALAMMAVASLAAAGRLNQKCSVAAQWLFLVGGVLFPAALYGLVFHGPRLLGAVAPVGGTAFILGWLMVAAAAWLSRDS